jgi:phosphatidate cytidylyltransferase
MVVVFWIGWAAGERVATVLFALIAFLALREFITLSPTRRGDHRSLVLAFFVVLPVQFWLAGTRHFDLFTVFIPVYVFLAIPLASALAGDPQRFLERNAKLQWGIMVCVYGMSHVPALLLLDFPAQLRGKSAFLVFFLVFVVQTCMLVQHLLTRRLKRPPSIPQVSRSFNWYSWCWAWWWAACSAALLSFITPFKPGQAVAMAFIACIGRLAGPPGDEGAEARPRRPAWGHRHRSPGPTGCWTGSTRCASPRRSSSTRCAGTSASRTMQAQRRRRTWMISPPPDLAR